MLYHVGIMAKSNEKGADEHRARLLLENHKQIKNEEEGISEHNTINREGPMCNTGQPRKRTPWARSFRSRKKKRNKASGSPQKARRRGLDGEEYYPSDANHQIYPVPNSPGAAKHSGEEGRPAALHGGHARKRKRGHDGK